MMALVVTAVNLVFAAVGLVVAAVCVGVVLRLIWRGTR